MNRNSNSSNQSPLHPVMYYTIDQCREILEGIPYKTTVKLVGCTVEELQEFSAVRSLKEPDTQTKRGTFWYNWASCKVSNHSDNRAQFTIKPDHPDITNEVWKDWEHRSKKKGKRGQVKIGVHILVCRVMYPDLVITHLGDGAQGVSHLCDTSHCFAFGHMDSDLSHGANMDRQRCLGVTLLVLKRPDQVPVIIQEELCVHAHGDLDKACRRIHVIFLSKLANDAVVHFNKN